MHEITTAVQIVLSQNCNGNEKPRLFGGQLMAWIDVVGAVAARRFTHRQVTTVGVDNLSFLKPAFLNDILVQEARVTWTGNTSLEVRVDSFVERMDGNRELINKAYLSFVAIDENDKPVRVPEFIPETPEEMAEYAGAVERKVNRMYNARSEG